MILVNIFRQNRSLDAVARQTDSLFTIPEKLRPFGNKLRHKCITSAEYEASYLVIISF
jgi:hypothetical protein